MVRPPLPMKTFLTLACLALIASPLPAAETPVPVQQEPFHQTVFENTWLRVIDVQVPVGKTTKYHVHVLPSVIVYLTKAANRSQTWGETTTTPRATTLGDSRYAPYDVTALTHQVTNPGPAHFRVLDIELLKPAGPTPVPPLATPNAQLRWDEKLVRSYSVSLPSGGQLAVPATANAHLVVGIAGTAAAGARRELRNGDYEFQGPNTAFQIRNAGPDQVELVLLELK